MQAIEIIVGRPMPLPLLAKPVRAHFPSPADDSIEEEIDLQRLLISDRPATSLVRVFDNGMVGAGLFDDGRSFEARGREARGRRGGRITLAFAVLCSCLIYLLKQRVSLVLHRSRLPATPASADS